jgi:YihY family inner membrane protein
MGFADRVDRFQRRHPAAGFPLAVVYKFVDDQGGYLAALVAYYGFVSLFPLLLLLSTILGFVLMGDPGLQQRVLSSALRQFPVLGTQLRDPSRIGGGTFGLIVGLVASVYGGLGVAQAIQHLMNTAWRVPRNSRPNPLKGRLRSLGLLATAGVAVLGTTLLSAIGSALSLGLVGSCLTLAASFALNALVFVVVFRLATARGLSVRQVAPGALLGALIWQLLQSFGVFYVRRVVSQASETNGVFAIVLGLIAFLYLAAVLLVFCVEMNVVRVEGLYPRSLLTPFTDDVDLTRGDRQAYSGQAETQRMKGFEDIDVNFDQGAQERAGPGPV